MKNTKKIFISLFLFILGFSIVFATATYIKKGKNWDANVTQTQEPNSNDSWTLNGRVNIADSRSEAYINDGYRGNIEGTITSELFGDFNITDNHIKLYKLKDFGQHSECNTTNNVEVYSMTGSIYSICQDGDNCWGNLKIQSDSYFCTNQYTYIKLKSETLGNKEIGTGTTQTSATDVFSKQEVYVKGILKVNGDTASGNLNRGDGNLNVIAVGNKTKLLAKTQVNKNIEKLFKSFKNFIENNEFNLNNFNSPPVKINGKENLYLYDYSGEEETIQYNSNNYINKGKILTIGNSGTDEIKITGINNIIVKSGNIYINSNLYNENDSNSLLILVAKRDKETKKGGNIYIEPDVTNIDAILIADGSIMSLDGDTIQSVGDTNQINNLRKQLLIYGTTMTSNVIGTDKIPYGADFYELDSNNDGTFDYPNNIMKNNIYDLGNLRTFNLNYGTGGTLCDNPSKLAPIDGNGDYLTQAWAGKKQCYIDDFFGGSSHKLKQTDKTNPLVIQYNPRLQLLSPYILSKHY